MTSWAAIVLLAALYFGGDQVGPCLGLNNAACVRAWEASHPHPPPLFDTSLAWPWIALLLIGLTVIQVIGRRRPRR